MTNSGVKYPTVFMDVDGVLSDLFGAIYKSHGKVYSPDNPECPEGEAGYYVAEALGVSFEDLWTPYTEDYVRNMNKLPEADAIMDIVNIPDRKWNIAFLTQSLSERLNGKYDWLGRYYPNIPRILTDVKTFCCNGVGSLLIDDCDQNVREWERWGGYPILFPRRWNSRHDEIEEYFPDKFVEEFYGWVSLVEAVS